MNIEKAKAEIQQLADKLKAELDAPEEFPQINEWYWTIDAMYQGVVRAKRMKDSLYVFRKSIGWYWRTEAEAQKHLDKLQAEERVRQYIAEKNKAADWMADFNDANQPKATWGYNHLDERIYTGSAYAGQDKDTWCHIKPELRDQLIKDCADDIKIIMGVA